MTPSSSTHKPSLLQTYIKRMALKEKYVLPVVIILITLHLCFTLIIPFFLYDNSFSVDMSGHYFSAWYIHDYLFPRATGWDPFFFFGYPHNVFYEPLFSYLVATLSYILPLALAFKVLVSSILILTPISTYITARSFRFSTALSASITLCVYSILLIPDSAIGGTFVSTMNTGLLPHALGLVLFFFFIAAVQSSIQTPRNSVFAGILLGLLCLTHLMSTITAIIFLIVFVLTSSTKNRFRVLGTIILLGFLLSAWWVIPALANSSFINADTRGDISSAALSVLTLIGYGIFMKYAHHQKEIASLWLFVITLTGLLWLGSFFNITMHYFRFTIFILITIPFLVFSFSHKIKSSLIVATFIFFFLMIILSPPLLSEGTFKKTIAPLPPDMYGNILVLSLPWQQDSDHELQQILPMQNHVAIVRGLFKESSLNSSIAYYFEKEFFPETATTSLATTPVTLTSTNSTEQLLKKFSVLNITHVIATTSLDPSWIPLVPITTLYFLNPQTHLLEKNEYWLYRVRTTNIATILPYSPSTLTASWNSTVENWFENDGSIDHILTNALSPLAPGKGTEKVTLLSQSPTGEQVSFFVDAHTDVPVYIKISYFPNWHAYSNGKEIPIYKASPYFMLVEGHGQITLSYEPTFVDVFSTILTSIGGILTLTLLWRLFSQNKPKPASL